MKTKHFSIGLVSMALLAAFTACSDEQQFTNENTDAKRIDVQQLSPEMQKVRDYVPLYACVAHRGTTYWAPEETEAAWRWARTMGADYLESDMQVTKDGVVLANHDENMKRTTNIDVMFSDEVPTCRKDFDRQPALLRGRHRRAIQARRGRLPLQLRHVLLLCRDADARRWRLVQRL